MTEPRLDAAQLEHVSADWLAALEARDKWLDAATSNGRHGKQLLPDGDWNILLWRAGRGFGKTAAESQALFWEAWTQPDMVGHFLGATLSDVRGTLFEGPAGILATIPTECLLGESREKAYNRTMHEVRLKNGSLIRGFATTEQADRLRGPQCHFGAFDEVAAWDRPAGNLEVAFNNAMYGVRLPYSDDRHARVVCGTTPRPVPFLKRLEKRADVVVIRGSSYENLKNLSPSFRAQLLSQAGTLMGKQEIDGEYIDEETDATILKRRWFRLWPADRKLPEFSYIIEAYDTAFAEENYNVKTQKTDPTACIVLGVFNIAQCFTEQERKRMGLRGRYAALLCEAWSERLGFPDLIERARKQHRIKWGAAPGRRADIVLIEQKASGMSVRQTLAKYSVPTWPYNPGQQSKTMRAHAVAPVVMQGGIFVPESMKPDRKGMVRDWVEPYLEEVCAFAGPGSTEHDDWVDCTTSALLYLRDRGILEEKPAEQFVDLEEKIAKDQDEAVRKYGEQRVAQEGNPYAW